MKAFSFLTILESLSKKLSILRTKMHSDDLRVNHGTITRVLRVSRPFSHCASSGASLGTSSLRLTCPLQLRRIALILCVLVLSVGQAWGASPYNLDITSYDWGGTGNKSANDGTVTISGYIQSKTYNNTGSTKVAYLDGSNYLTISATSACITSITVTANTDNNSNKHEIAYQTSTDGSSWSASTNIDTCANRKSAPTSLTANFSPAVQYVRFTKGGSNSISVGAISITYTDGGGETPDPDPDQPGTGGDGDCPESGEIFALSGWSNSNTAEWKDKSLIETKITGLTTLTNGEVYAVSIEKDKKCGVNGSGENMAYSLGYNSVALRIDLDCELRVGDVITITSNGYHSNAFIFTNTGSRGNSVSSTTTSGTTKTYTVTEDDVLKGNNTIYIWRSGSTVNIKAINITRPASSDPTCTAVAAPTDLTCSARTNSSLTFGWTAASNASEYVVTLYSDANCTTQVSSQTITGTSCTFTGLSGNTTYYCKVQSKGDGTTYCTNGGTTNATSGTTLTTPTITFNNGSYTVGGSALDLSTLFESNSNGAVTYTVTNANGTGATIDGTSFTASAAGTATVKATQAANGDYCSGEATATITVNAAPVTPEPEPEDVAGEDFPNPERGFYEHAEWSHASRGNYNDNLWDSYFDDARAANRSLLLRIYYLDTEELRQNKQLPNGFITMFNNDMQKIRNNGMKCILRFAYDKDTDEDGDEDYNDFEDASPATWETHLAQLKPYLQANADVIYVVQAGFLGVWGEWYYSKQGTGDEISEEIKNNLIDQLLAAVPANRCVQLRTPLFKKEYLGNNKPLTPETAYKGTAQARLGHHNDAFLNGEKNQGTYENRTTDMEYIAQECLYVPIGGETNLEESQVSSLYEKYCKGTVAEAEMAQLHYSYLNHSYSTVVTNRWKEEGSYARMSKQLGYRFELESATLPNEATAGTPMNVQLNIKNVGYAPLYNERYAYIVFKNNTNTYSIKLSSDPRTWAPNKVTTTINENVTLPVDMLAGTYDMYLHLPDASNNIAKNPKYAVRFANQGIWESETGYNKLNKQVVVTATDLDTYTITFKNGETVLQTSTIEYGATPEYTGKTPTKAEDAQYTYTFEGWSPEITAVTGNATYTATFTQTAKTYTLTWDVNGGNALTGDYTTGTVAYGTTITKPADPTREGYTFAGWSPAVAATMPAANTTYTAQWNEIKVASITVNPTTLDLKKGESATVTATVSPADALNKTVTWANTSITTLSSETGNSITVTGKSNGKDKELKASAGGKQATVKVSVYYEVQYNSNGGSACTAGKCYDSNGVTLPEPTKAGYTFAGWYKNEALTQSAGAAGDTYKPSDNITLYAKWTVAKTNPTTTWTVAETVYAGQLVSVSVTTNSDATLTTSSLTTNKGTLVNATVNGQTITATLQVPGDASDDITLTLRTDATEKYNASTSTKTITISECPTNGGGEETVTLAATDNQESGYFFVGDGSIITNIVGQGAKSVSFSGKNDDKKSKITVDASNNEATITFTIGTGVTITSFKAIGTANEKTQYDLDGTTVTIGTALTGLNKTSSMVFKLSCTDASGSSNRNTEISSFVLTYTSSGSGESTLPTNLAWSTDLSAGVSKQAGTTFTYTASSNNSAGAITYSSSDENIAAVDPTTGEVTTKAAGTAIITATIAEIGCYPTKSITYTLTVTSTGEPEPTTYTVTVNSTTNGTVTADKTTNVAQGETVTLTVTPASGYELGILTVKDASDNNVTVTDNTFIMPASNVTVSATFTAIETPEPGSYRLTYDENKPAVWNDDFAVKNIPAAQTLPNGTGNLSTNTPVITEAANSDYAIYDFAGWNTAKDGTGKSYAAGAAITITEKTTLYAQWTPRTFDVKYFDTDKKTPLEGMVNTTYTFGVGIPNLPTPTKPGHTFIRWHLFYDGEGGTIIEEPVVSLANDIWGVLQLAAQWTENCTMPTTTFANGRYVIGSGALDLRTLIIADKNSEGEITYAVTGGVAATINGSSFTCDRIGVVTVTATQAASGGYCEKIMTATINVAMPVTDGCAQMFTFKANDAINNPDGQKGQKYLDLSSYATINGLSTTGKVGIKDMETSDDESTTLIKNNEIYFPNTNTYLKVENLSTPLAAGDVITIDATQDNNEYIITISGTQCKSNCITTTNQQYTIPAESSLIGVTTFYIWAKTEQTHLNTINICRPAYEITYMANNGTDEAESLDNAVLVAGCPNTFTVPAGKQFAGWNTAADGKGTSYSVGTIIPLNNLILYAQWKCIEPVFTVSCDKTAYAKDEANAEPITVSVTAGNSGGVTYQWYASDKNDRTTGTAITGAIAASYTPSTATAGTTYYWCEISNSCTTVKTPTIAITVTVTKEDANVEWTYFDATPTQGGTIHYGGGNYMITAQVVEDWNGTLTADMLTAPDGIYVYGAMAQGNTISAYFDVTTSFDRVANPNTIPFYLSLPETDEYDPLVSIGNVPYEACTTGGESGTVILAADGTNKLKTWKNGNFSVTCNTKNGAQKTYVKPSANDTFEFSTTGGETILSVDIYHSASTSLSESTKTIITAPNTTSNLNYFTVSEANNNKIIVKATNQCYVFKTVVTYISGNGEDVSLEWDTEDDLTNQVEKEQSDPNFTYKATPSTNTLGTITYSSSNTNVATVNPNTGEVEIVATGVEEQTTTITATLAPSGCYKGATATYTISVAGMDCEISAGTLALTNGAENKCSGESVTLALTGYTADGTTIQWYKGDAIIEGATTATYTTAEQGTYSVLVTDNNNNACAKRSNTITITNISTEASVTNIVNTWYIKSGRLTPPIALWKLKEGTTFLSVTASVGWDTGTGFTANAFFEKDGIVYLTGTPPQANETDEDKTYTLTLKVKDVCGGEHTIPSTITIVHQKNTDKHVLAFVVTGTEKGGFTEGITTAQTTNVPLYNEISQVFDVLATNIYATDNEQLLKEYYSRFDIICITDYPDSKKTGVNGKSYTNAMGALIDIRPILSMEAWVSKYSNWNDKGITGDPKSPTTRQYSMLLQCKDHEIFVGTNLIQEGSGDELMYRVTMVDKNQEQYKTLDDTYGATTPHAEKATTKIDDVETITGYGYGSNPALQGFTYTSSMSSMLPIGIIDDGDGNGNNLQVGLERQYEIEARMIVLGVNSYAMERLTDDGERVIVNTLKYLMKKQSSEIADCSIYFDNNNGKGDNQWNNPANWAPSRNSLPHASQEARILAPCIVSDVVAKVASIKIVPDGKYAPAYNGGIDAKGSLTIAPDGALVVGGHIQAATAPNYYEARPTTPENLIVQAEVESDSQHRLGALIHNNEDGETSATIQMWNPSYWEIDQETGKKKKYWSYVAVPIQEAPIPEFFYHGFTYLYDETQGWIKKGDGTTLYPFQGIGASLQTGNKETFYGKLATTDDQDIILTKTAGVGEGQNLIGNSWTAPIQIANFEEEDFNGATATVYIYNTGRDDYYKNPTYVEGSAENDGAATAGQWIGVPIGVAGLAEYTGLKVIPAMNAFQVNTAQETELHLNYNRLVRGEGKGGVNSESNLNQPMRAPHKPIEALMRIRVAGEKTHTDMWLLQDERFDYGFDNGWEAEFVEGDDRSAQLYAVSEIGKMAFLAQPELDGTLLGFAPSRDGAEYTFSFYYTGSQKLYLNDLKLQTSTLVSDNDTYLFTYEKGDEQRFIISTAPFNIPDISTGVGNTTNGENAKAVKFIKDDKIFIFVNGMLYDATGKMVIR